MVRLKSCLLSRQAILALYLFCFSSCVALSFCFYLLYTCSSSRALLNSHSKEDAFRLNFKHENSDFSGIIKPIYTSDTDYKINILVDGKNCVLRKQVTECEVYQVYKGTPAKLISVEHYKIENCEAFVGAFPDIFTFRYKAVVLKGKSKKYVIDSPSYLVYLKRIDTNKYKSIFEYSQEAESFLELTFNHFEDE